MDETIHQLKPYLISFSFSIFVVKILKFGF